MKCTTIFLLLVVNVACGTLPDREGSDDDARTAVIHAVTEAERERLRKMFGMANEVGTADDWIDVIVDAEIVEVGGVRFYLARNDRVDPPVNYAIARTLTGTLFKLGGFDNRESEFDRLIRELAVTHSVSDPRDAVGLSDAYFQFVEQWTPGIPEERHATPLLRRQSIPCIEHSDNFAFVKEEDDGTRVVAVLFDSPSGRVECVEVTLSLARGFSVVRRTVLVARSRTEL